MKLSESTPDRPDYHTYQGRGTDHQTRRMGRRQVSVPINGIIAFNGALVTIPANWHLCDGTNGTPDLCGLFIQGAAAGADPGATGGSTSKTTNGHAHNPYTTQVAVGTGANAMWAVYGNTDTIADIRPLFYDLAYIMRIS